MPAGSGKSRVVKAIVFQIYIDRRGGNNLYGTTAIYYQYLHPMIMESEKLSFSGMEELLKGNGITF